MAAVFAPVSPHGSRPPRGQRCSVGRLPILTLLKRETPEESDEGSEDAAARTTKGQALGGDQSALQVLISTCNKDGMQALESGNHEAAFAQFKYAEAILLANQKDHDNTPLLAVTCNNLGCYYKKVGKLHGALSYLRRALKMETELNTDAVTMAGTHLNLCAILSKLEKHDKAVQHALRALEMMSDYISESSFGRSEDDYAVLALAYHHVATERDFQERWDQAASCFQQGHQVAKRLLGETHPMATMLGQNCEAVLKKATQSTKLKMESAGQHSRARTHGIEETTRLEGGSGGGTIELPALPNKGSQQAGAKPLYVRSSTIRNDAESWIRSEEAAWDSFAKKMLGDDVGIIQRRTPTPEPLPPGGVARSGSPATAVPAMIVDVPDTAPAEQPGPPPLSAETLRDLQESEQLAEPMPKAHDMGQFRFAEVSKSTILKKQPLVQALDDHPDALMDIIESSEGAKISLRSGATDYRPNRSMHRSSRTSRLVRRTGVFNSTAHRDQVAVDLAKRREVRKGAGPNASAALQKLAAERIQAVWRSWHRYCQENAEWMTVTWICATMIQSVWRSYHVRRVRMDQNAETIQRHARGFLVRSVLKRHAAAVAIQRHVVGMIERRKILQLHEAAKHIQRLTRGGLARKKYADMRVATLERIITIQRRVRVRFAMIATAQRREEARIARTREKAVVDMQRFFRGAKGREKAFQHKMEKKHTEAICNAALRIQLLVRRRKAKRRMKELRLKRLQEMDSSATFIRKLWVARQVRKRYKSLLSEFASRVNDVVTIQRYIRGCFCRLKLWREAVRAEEELWAAVSIQRVWRGYVGRVRWEMAYEDMWRREVSAALLQRNLRGWHARLCASRLKRKLARAEFERARERFRGAVKVQALVRGVLTRKIMRVRHQRAKHAAIAIQRIERGRALRKRLWTQIEAQRATMIQAAVRGFLVRKRRSNLLAKVILIQRTYRQWRMIPKFVREYRTKHSRRRKEKATTIQRAFREYGSNRKVKQILALGGR